MRNLQEMAKRISANHCGKGCDGCPAAKWRGENNVCLVRRLAKTSNCEEQIEKLKLWDEEHPEKRYPSWYEVWAKKFPNGKCTICPLLFDETYECNGVRCDSCRANPIPENIAKAFGVEPVIEHDGCWGCIHYDETGGVCWKCKGTVAKWTEEWKRRDDFYER